jgi:uncharacterized protein (DUF58 family)
MNITPLSYLLVFTILIMGIVDQWYPNGLTSLWRILGAAYLLILLLEWRITTRRQFHIERDIAHRIYLGRSHKLRYSITCQARFPVTIKALDNYNGAIQQEPEVMVWHVKPNETLRSETSITPTELGELSWDTIQARIKGDLGFAWWSRKLSVSTKTLVIPDRLQNQEQHKTATRHQGDISRRTLGSGHELLGLREYLPGDPLHYLDWKATARSRKPMVRLFSDEQHLELVIVIDAGRTSSMLAGNITRLGHYTNIASRLAQKAFINGDQVSLVVFADNVISSIHRLRGASGLQRLRSILENIQPVKRESNPLPAILRVRQLVAHRSLVVMLTDIDDGDAAAQLVRAMSLLRPKHLPVLAAINDSEVRKLRDQTSQQWIDPFHALAANEIIQNWRHTRVRLEKMGVPVVLADVAHLDQGVLNAYDHVKEKRRI